MPTVPRAGATLIYVRSRRPLLTAAAAAVCVAVMLGLAAWAVSNVPGGRVVAISLWAGSALAVGVAGSASFRIRAWPPGRLAFFRDRMVVVSGRHEMRAVWDQVLAVTLADMTAWPDAQMTDRVTVCFRSEAPIRFRPAEFGLDPAGCRDLLARLRDEPELRERLPEFDSQRDLESAPLVAGEASEPRL